MSWLHLLDVLQSQRPRGQVAWISKVALRLQHKSLEVRIRDHRLATNHQVSLLVYLLRNTRDGRCQMSDVGTDMSVATSHHLGQPTVVVGHDESQTVQFPRQPDTPSVSPFHQFSHTLRLGKRQGRELMFLLLSRHVVFRHLGSRRVGQGDTRFLLHQFQPVEQSVPFVVAHQFPLTVIVSLRGLVQFIHPLPHQHFLLCHIYINIYLTFSSMEVR